MASTKAFFRAIGKGKGKSFHNQYRLSIHGGIRSGPGITTGIIREFAFSGENDFSGVNS
jgi:hypothetical protein